MINLYDYCLQNEKGYLLKEWDYAKNSKTPKEYTSAATDKVWWRCEKGHSWETAIANRSNRKGSNCPYCSNNKVQKGFNDLATTHPHLIKEWDFEKNIISPFMVSFGTRKKVWWKCEKGHSYEASINKRAIGRGCSYCAGKKVLLGYNDLYSVNPELAKEWDFEKNDLTPKEVTYGSNKVVWWRCEKGHSWQAPITVRNYSGSGCPKCSPSTSIPEICILLALRKIFNSVEHKKIINKVEYDVFINDINLALEYDGEFYHKDRRKEDDRKVKLSKELKFNFIRVYEVKGLVDFDSFRLEKDILYLQSNITKNYPLLCQNVINYIAKIYKLNLPIINLQGIEIEARDYRKQKELENSLQNKYPFIASQWHPTKNGNLKPSSFPSKSSYKAWWVCENGHEWQTTISHRVEGSGCPYCFKLYGRGKREVLNLEDWCKENNREDLLREWDYLNNEKSPKDYTRGSDKLVWWVCQNGHHWQKVIRNRTKYHKGCPYCEEVNKS